MNTYNNPSKLCLYHNKLNKLLENILILYEIPYTAKYIDIKIPVVDISSMLKYHSLSLYVVKWENYANIVDVIARDELFNSTILPDYNMADVIISIIQKINRITEYNYNMSDNSRVYELIDRESLIENIPFYNKLYTRITDHINIMNNVENYLNEPWNFEPPQVKSKFPHLPF